MWWMALALSMLGVPDIAYSGTDNIVLVDEESSCDPKYNLMMERVDRVSVKVDEMSVLVNESLQGMTERLDRMSRSMMKMATVFRQLPEIMVQLKQHSKDCCSSKTTTESPIRLQEFEKSELQILEDVYKDHIDNNTNPVESITVESIDVTSESQVTRSAASHLPFTTESTTKVTGTGINNFNNSHSTTDKPYITVSSEPTLMQAPSEPIPLLTTSQPYVVTSTTEKVQPQPSATNISDTTNKTSANLSETPPDAIQVQVLQLSNTSDFETENGCESGFFRVNNECFRAFKTKFTWEAARNKCAAEGLRMAEPRDPVALADYLKNKIAPFYYWLGGKGDGSTFRWLTGSHIAATSLYWFSQYPVSLFSNCLILLASHNFPTDVPFYAQPCDKNYFVLCQDADCCDGQLTKEEVREPRIITKGIITWVTSDEDTVIEDTNTQLTTHPEPIPTTHPEHIPTTHPEHIPIQHNETSTRRNNKTMNDYIVRGCDSESFYIGSQCFITYLDKKVNWELAQKKCASEGLILAQPDDPVALAFYLRHYVASSPFWLGADGDGTAIRWLNSSVMEESSPLWYHSPSSRLNNCLMLLTNAYYQTPLYAEKCFAKFYTICQGNSSAIDVIFKSDDAETFIELSTTEEPDNMSLTTKVPECNNEFFRLESGCYKSITDVKQYTWELAAEKCQAEGLKLAEPENPIALANYLKNNVEPSYFWMGGSADGWTFRWVNGSVIPASSRLWYRYQPSAAMGNCLLLMATTSLTNLAPLYDNPCNDLHYAVCQMVI